MCLKRKNKFLSINYKDIKSNLSNLSYFLEVSLDDLEDNFFNKPVIKKNKIIYEDNFDNLSDLKKLNNKLENKIDELSKKKFKFNDIINFDSENKKLKINI